jgi:hypothetical protein
MFSFWRNQPIGDDEASLAYRRAEKEAAKLLEARRVRVPHHVASASHDSCLADEA